jgi:hypothetical protein
MPLVDDKPPVLFGKLLRSRKLTHFQAQGFAKLDALFQIEDCFAPAVANVNMDRSMFVAIKEEPISVLLKNFRHRQLSSDFESSAIIL